MGAIQQAMLGLGSSVPAFSPLDIAGLDWWLEADTIAGNDGDAVVDWADNTGNAPFGQNTGARQPVIKTGLYNGHRAVRFVATQCLVPDPTGRSLAAANTLICVCTPSSTASGYILKGSGGQGGPAFISAFSSVAFEYFFTATAGHERATYASSASGLHILTLTKTDNTGNYVGYYDGNGTPVFSNAIHASDDWDPESMLLIGSFTAGSSTNQFTGDICEILHWPSVLSGPNLTLIHDYLKAKYSIA